MPASDAPASLLSPPPAETPPGDFAPKRLAEAGRALAQDQSVTLARRAGLSPRRLFREAYRGLPDAYKQLTEAASRGVTATPAAEWLLDNFYLIRAQLKQVREDLPWNYYRQLPKLERGPYRGFPRVYEMVHGLAAQVDNAIDEEALARYLKGFQDRSPLRIGELWAVPSMLRLVLLDRLATQAQAVTADLEEAEDAQTWAEGIAQAAESDPSAVVFTLAAMAEAKAPLSGAFVTALATALQQRGTATAAAIDWLDQRFAGRDRSLDAVMQTERQRQAGRQASVSNAINTLRRAGEFDWAALVERVSYVERSLRQDPAGVYTRMDFATRDRYRRRVETLARHTRASEVAVADRAVALARQALEQGRDGRAAHVGAYLAGLHQRELDRAVGYRPPLGRRLRELARRHPGWAYFSVLGFGTAALMVGAWLLASSGGVAWWAVAAALLIAFFPALTLGTALTNWAFTRLMAPALLPKMAFEDGIEAGHDTFVVVPTLLTSPEGARQQVAKLEVQALANPDPRLRFALLTDFADADAESLESDEAIVEAAAAAIEELNARYAEADRARGEAPSGDRFFLFHRPREWNPAEGVWMGWERKRGKLEVFNRLLRRPEDTSAYSRIVGEYLPFVSGDAVQHVITLDADTQLPPQAARDLVRTAAHPLNRPVYSPEKRRVVAGYGVLQPRVGIRAETGFRTAFARLFAGNVGSDPYTHAVSDVYQDLFGEGIFTGKGLYNVDAFRAALEDIVPENTVLSHDLLEGAHARTALVTDVVLFDDYPSHYAAFAKRLHRWVRGDWQILPWLFGLVPTTSPEDPEPQWKRNPLGGLARWMIFDNLRRSLVGPSMLLFLLLAWITMPGPALLWTLLALGVIAFQVYAPFTNALLSHPRDAVWSSYLLGVVDDVKHSTKQAAFSVALLAHEGVLMLDAIGRTLWRMARGKRLLEWVTAQQAEARGGDAPGIWLSVVWGGLVLVLVGLFEPGALPLAAPFALAWMAAPWIARWTGRTVARVDHPLPDEARPLLRLTARKTWRFFDDLLTEADHHLAPDNYQEHPFQGIAHRTSPTNIGLGLVAVQAAVDFGYLSPEAALKRIDATLTTLEGMERCHGHFYNWYDTRTAEPLLPRYVSMVDSGNLVGALLTLKQGLLDLGSLRLDGARLRDGFVDTLDALDEVTQRPRKSPTSLDGVRAAAAALRDALGARTEASDGLGARYERARSLLPLAEALHEAAQAVQIRSETDKTALAYWTGKILSRLKDGLAFIERLVPGLASGTVSPEEDAARTLGDLAAVAQARVGGDGAPAGTVLEVLERARALADRADALATAHEFGFLYRDRIGLFAIGYNADTGELDDSNYNLFASEARLGSLLAIALGDVPPKHWIRLSRPTNSVYDRRVLLSWSGTLFEYLMPLLFTRVYEGSLVDDTCRSAVSIQRRYGRRRGLPWGISESAYFRLDQHLTYQYRAFGAPGLGLKRGLAEDYVVAPYASALALMVRSDSAYRNLKRLKELGAWGDYGFYEAVDYTKRRLPPGDDHQVVGTYMAHHQGMALLAIQNVLMENAVQERFHADPLVQSVEPLLQEQAPREIRRVAVPDEMAEIDPVSPPTVTGASRRVGPERLADDTPHGHLLTGGRLATFVTAAGAGFTRFEGAALTRWRPDRTREADGHFLYVRDLDSGAVWSATAQPAAAPGMHTEAWFHTGHAELISVHDGIEVKCEIAVSPEDNVEVRRYAVVNRSGRPRRIELTSYAEVVLQNPTADLAHPAFSKLFVRTQPLQAHHAVLATRRGRSEGDRELWLFHALADEHPEFTEGALEWETDRAQFIGRGRTLANPQALEGPLSGTTGPVLDPVVSLRRVIALPPQRRAVVSFATGAADTREEAVRLADRYDHPASAQRALELAEVYGLVELQHLGLTGKEALLAHELGTALLYGNPALRADAVVLRRNRRPQSGLWAYGISGDLPICVFRITRTDQVDALRTLIRMHALWRARGLETDLIVLNEHPPSYADELQHAIQQEVMASPSHGLLDQRGGVFVRRREHLAEEDVVLMMTAAHVVLDGALPTLGTQGTVRTWDQRTEDTRYHLNRRDRDAFARHEDTTPQEEASGTLPGLTPAVPAAPAAHPWDDAELDHFNGWGGFTPDASEYVIRLPAAHGDAATPLPWTNVVANEGFGFIVTEAGGGYAWCLNSQQNKLTPWSNDPVLDTLGLALYLRDEDTGEVWTVPPRDGTPYEVRHGFGYSVFRTTLGGVEVEATLFVPREDPVQIARLKLTDRSGRARKLAVYRYAQWVLDERVEKSRPFIRVRPDVGTGALFARNPYNATFGHLIAFADAALVAGGPEAADPAASGTDLEDPSFTADRTAFLGRGGSPQSPLAVRRGGPLGGEARAGLDACAAFRVPVALKPHGEATVVATLGQTVKRDAARALVLRYRDPETVDEALETVRAFWRETLGRVQIETPSRVIDPLANGWLVYQNLCCRLWGRSAFYQSGGAFGFRDQIQDACALVYTRPDLLRSQLLLHAAHQFEEGDVLHWWHQAVGAGIRSRFSDDLLWLPYATARYVRVTGDAAVLDETARFITARALEEGEDETFVTPEDAGEGTLFEHGCRALDRSLTRGPHELPLMGSGDWNDGMNRVGNEGRGESVWLGFFLAHILDEWIPLTEARGETERAEAYRAYRAHLQTALNDAGWDGQWYRRAYYDNGAPLGSAQSDECRIDAIAQGWSILSGVAPDDRAELALQSAEAHLVDEDDEIIRLLTPPFDTTPHDPGYIKGYLPGVRENGGQYTHGVLWLIAAFAERGHGTRATELLEMLTPVSKTDTRPEAAVFKTEPYAVAADVYSVHPHEGRGGWTWYTGSAGWMYRVALESILGFGIEGGDTLTLDPRIPSTWPHFTIRYRHHDAHYTIRVTNPDGVERGIASATVDGEPADVLQGRIAVPLKRAGTHEIAVGMGS